MGIFLDFGVGQGAATLYLLAANPNHQSSGVILVLSLDAVHGVTGLDLKSHSLAFQWLANIPKTSILVSVPPPSRKREFNKHSLFPFTFSARNRWWGLKYSTSPEPYSTLESQPLSLAINF